MAALAASIAAFRPPAAPANPPAIVLPQPPAMPEPPEKLAPGPESLKRPADPKNAVCRIQFGNAGCTATVIGPRRPDGRWDLLTANHCVEKAPSDGMAIFRNGLSLKVVRNGNWPGPDVAWLVTQLPVDELPYTLLADTMPKQGDKVYHCGFGVDNPGNVENGTVTRPDNGDGMTMYRISVSSGDSGGGIAMTADGKVLSPVCCTSAKGQVADVFGGTVNECRRLRPTPSPVAAEWTPIEIPMKMQEP